MFLYYFSIIFYFSFFFCLTLLCFSLSQNTAGVPTKNPPLKKKKKKNHSKKTPPHPLTTTNHNRKKEKKRKEISTIATTSKATSRPITRNQNPQNTDTTSLSVVIAPVNQIKTHPNQIKTQNPKTKSRPKIESKI